MVHIYLAFSALNTRNENIYENKSFPYGRGLSAVPIANPPENEGFGFTESKK